MIGWFNGSRGPEFRHNRQKDGPVNQRHVSRRPVMCISFVAWFMSQGLRRHRCTVVLGIMVGDENLLSFVWFWDPLYDQKSVGGIPSVGFFLAN